MNGSVIKIKLHTILVFVFLLSIQNVNADTALIPDSIQYQLNTLSPSDQIEFLNNTGWYLRDKSPELAIQLSKQALQLSENLKLHKKSGEINNRIAAIYLNYLHDLKSTLPYLEEAQQIGKQINDSIQLAYCYNNLGDLYYKTNNIPLAIKYDLQSFNIFSQINYKRGIAYSLTNLGEAYSANHEYEKALEYFLMLNEIEREQKNRSGISFSLFIIGKTYFDLQNIKEAKAYYNEALQLSTQIKNNSLKARCLMGLADIHIIQKQYKQAIHKIEEASVINIESNYVPGIINNKLNLALLLAKTNNANAGKVILQEGIELANNLGFPMYILKAYQAQVDFYTIQNNDSLIISSYDTYFKISDSLIIAQSTETINEMFSGMKAQSKIKSINKDLEKQEREIGYLSIILILFLSIVFLLILRVKTINNLNKQLQETNSTKDKLFSIIGHDLKSPFNSILGFSDLLITELSQKNYDKALFLSKNIHQSSSKLFSLITNLLDWSRSQRNLIALQKEELNIHELIEKSIDIYSSEAASRNIDFIYKKTDLNTVYADKNSLETVLRNLLSNAIKYSKNNTTITIETKSKNQSTSIKITDQGIGIPTEQVKHLFDTNHTSTPGINNEQGTGLGLTICKEFIEKQDGKLLVESLVEKGSTFEIVLPTKG